MFSSLPERKLMNATGPPPACAAWRGGNERHDDGVGKAGLAFEVAPGHVEIAKLADGFMKRLPAGSIDASAPGPC
ncbi:hypothetical protein [Lysobacter sp. CA199]|uniref:hypothetical protein n=1 Tax=Lysobacter sp. CA199 TaxID=3455608 RepID=UPI003F8D0978